MSTLTPHQLATLDTSGHLALTANAGSGKTFVLARKYLNSILNDGLDISNIAAITFTDKAASELYLKISLLIDDRINETDDLKVKRKLERIRRQLVSANISTIHSFCINILRDFPVEANLDARFTPIDEALSRELIELSIEETIRSLFENKEHIDLIKYLIRIFSSKNKLVNQLVRLIQNRKNVFKIRENYSSLDEEQLSKYFNEYFVKDYLLIWYKLKPDFISSLQNINNAVLLVDSKNPTAIELKTILLNLENSFDVKTILININQIKIAAFTKELTLRKKGYAKPEVIDQNLAHIYLAEKIISELSVFEYSNDDNNIEKELAKLGKILLVVFDKALKTYELKKNSNGYIDYEDILLHTKILLENEDVQKRIAVKYDFIMVDEFQDTNEIQYQIFLPILDYLKKGKLFIVGDEKQSIYKFRDAEIEIFNLTKNDIKESDGDKNLLVLPDSFRMAPNICAFCNSLFRKLFENPSEKFGEVQSTDLVCARGDGLKGKVEILVSRKADEYESLSEQELIANKILNIVSEGKYSFKDISILVRKRKHFNNLEKEFQKKEIPFTIIGGRGFYQRQIISDIYNYLSFLVDQNNSASLVGILRSPFFTLSDTKLFSISLLQGKNFWEKINTVQDNDNIKSICLSIKENIQLSNSLSLSQLIEKIISDRNFLAVVSSKNNGEQEIANISKLISISRTFNSTGFRNLYDFINYLKEAIQNQADESQAGITSNKDAVQMMTIHQSKGLEFPIVFIFNANESGLSSSIKAGEIAIDKNYGLLAKVPLSNNYFDDYHSAPIVKLYNYFEEKKNNAELKRLLYVAVTRAKDELFISLTLKKDSGFKNDSFIKLLAEGFASDFTNDKIVVHEKLELLKIENEAYQNVTEEISLSIPIISNIDFNPIMIKKQKTDIEKLEVNIKQISNYEKGEIISASKVSIYSQCSLKYLLTYEYGFGKLNSEIRTNISESSKNYFISEEDDDDSYSEKDNYDSGLIALNWQNKINPALYGRLFHKAIELPIKIDQIEKFINNEIGNSGSNENETIFKRLKTDLNSIYKSNIWQKLSAFQNQKNEFEIYVKEKDYYLHGIIDKIVFEGNQVKVFDYKTDEIELKEIKKHSEFYLMQLKFYLYIASRLFTEFDSFEGSLIFVIHPDHPVTITFEKKDIRLLEQEILTIINSIRNKSSEKKIEHCKFCSFSDDNNNCIIN